MTVRRKDSGVANAAIEESATGTGDNFISYFLNLCEEYDVSPLPKICAVDGIIQSKQRNHPRDDDSSIKTSDPRIAPLIYVTHRNSNTRSNPEKLECRGYRISVCILDALGESMKKFATLTTIRLSNCRINAFGITQISRVLSEIGSVRDLNLDMNPNIEENYYLLCAESAKLQHLSLKYCNISDAALEKIAQEISVSPHLIGLDLANNCISNIGARHIAAMLHTNRSLQSLILTGNRIGDSGALSIIQELCKHPLTRDEIVRSRRQNFKTLLNANSPIVAERVSQPASVQSLSTRKFKISKRSVGRKKSTSSRQSVDNEKIISTRKIGEVDPTNVHRRLVNEETMAIGNLELQHLNLSYNHLRGESLRKMVECMFYQSYTILGDTTKGLLYIHLEGNDIRQEENETWDQLRELLHARRSSENPAAAEIA